VNSLPSGPGLGARAERPDARSDRLKVFRFASAVIWTVLILSLCWIPGSIVHKVEQESSWFRIPELDKAIHAGMFVVLAILCRRVDWSRRAVGAVILGGFALGAMSELGQLLPIIHRTASLYDLAVDCVGLIVGVAIAPSVEPLFRMIERRLMRVPSAPEPAQVEQ
jgi:hypothetical protein